MKIVICTHQIHLITKSASNCNGMKLKSTVVVIVALALLQIVDNRSTLKWTNVKCNSLNKDFLYFKLCRIKALKRDVTALSVHVVVLHKPLDNLTLSLVFKQRGMPNSRSIYGYKIDACAFYRNKRRNPFAVMFYKLMGFEEHSNMNHTCPYNHDLILDDYRFDQKNANLLPLPAGHYTIYSEWFCNQILRANVELNMEISEKYQQ